jgi:hypothetical protein
MHENKNAQTILVKNLKERDHLEAIGAVDFKGVNRDDNGWIYLAKDRVKSRAVLNTVMKFLVL